VLRACEWDQIHASVQLADFQSMWDTVLDLVVCSEELAACKSTTLVAVQPLPVPPTSGTRSRAWLSTPALLSGTSGTLVHAPTTTFVALRQTLVAQAREWLGASYTRQRDALLRQMLDETWSVVPPGTLQIRNVQSVLDRSFAAVASATSDGALSSSTVPAVGSSSAVLSNSAGWEARRWDDEDDDASGAGAAGGGRALQIGGERFFAVSSLLALLDIVNAVLAVRSVMFASADRCASLAFGTQLGVSLRVCVSCGPICAGAVGAGRRVWS